MNNVASVQVSDTRNDAKRFEAGSIIPVIIFF